jgi:hypothetical protein
MKIAPLVLFGSPDGVAVLPPVAWRQLRRLQYQLYEELVERGTSECRNQPKEGGCIGKHIQNVSTKLGRLCVLYDSDPTV